MEYPSAIPSQKWLLDTIIALQKQGVQLCVTFIVDTKIILKLPSPESTKMDISLRIACKCGHYFVKNGKNKHGDQKYVCGKKCGASFVDSDRKVGRPCLFDKPLTDAEKTARSRAKKKLPPN